MWIALIVCSTLLAVYGIQAWTSWLRWRHERRVESVEALLPLDGETPEYVLSAVQALTEAGRGFYGRREVRDAVWRARMARVAATFADIDARLNALADAVMLPKSP